MIDMTFYVRQEKIPTGGEPGDLTHLPRDHPIFGSSIVPFYMKIQLWQAIIFTGALFCTAVFIIVLLMIEVLK